MVRYDNLSIKTCSVCVQIQPLSEHAGDFKDKAPAVGEAVNWASMLFLDCFAQRNLTAVRVHICDPTGN